MQKQIIEAGFDLLSKEISDMKIVDLPFKLKKFGLILSTYPEWEG